MTGHDIAVLRTMLGWSREELGALLLTTQSAVYRWEQHGDQPCPLDPRNYHVLKALQAILDRPDITDVRAQLESVRCGGGLRGLYTILRLYFDEAQLPPPFGEEAP